MRRAHLGARAISTYVVAAVVGVAALWACASPAHQSTKPGSIELTVSLPKVQGSPQAEAWVRAANGETRFEYRLRDGAATFAGLAPGVYDVAAKIPFALNGPWIYSHQSVAVRSGTAARVHLAPPLGRDARLAIATEPDTPPFYLVLAEAGSLFPTEVRDLQQRLAQHRYPDGLVFALQSDGRSGLGEIPALPAGRYVLVQVANDWRTGDPPIAGRSMDLELRSGATTTLHLENKLTRMRVE